MLFWDQKDWICLLPYSLYLQQHHAKDSIYTYKAAELFTKRKSVTVKNTAPASSGKAQYYKVRRGDTLSGIAVKYKTTVSRLRSLNGIKGNRITAGKSIRVR